MNLKPLFQHVNGQLSLQLMQLQQKLSKLEHNQENKPSSYPELVNLKTEQQDMQVLVDELRRIAKEVARKQAFRLSSGNGVDTGKMEFHAGTVKPIDQIVIVRDSLNVEVHKVSDWSTNVSLKFGGGTFGPFEVTYFDMPLIDNAKIENLRVSLVLLGTVPVEDKAYMRVIAFDSDLATDRIDITEMTRLLRTVKNRYE